MSVASRERFDQTVAKIVASLIQDVGHGLSNKKWRLKNQEWNSAYVDWRRGPDPGDATVTKLRVVLRNGKTFARLHTSDEVDALLDDLWKLKDEVFSKPWYGLKLEVFPDGKRELQLDHDPKCVVDPHFWEPD
jgi:hypothetical protein